MGALPRFVVAYLRKRRLPAHDSQSTTYAALIRCEIRIDTDEARAHRTSPDPRSSVGRWRSEFDARTQALATEILGESLEALGYEV